MKDSIDPVISFNGLTKRFRKVTALSKLDLKIYPGDVLALLGSNGSGKTTTFRLLLNIYLAQLIHPQLLEL